MKSVTLDINISNEVDSLVEKICANESTKPVSIELLKCLDMENNYKINCMLYKLASYTMVIIEFVLEDLSTGNKKVYSKTISSYSELYVPMIEVFNNIKYIINFKFDNILKPLSNENKLNKLKRIYQELDEDDGNKMINATNFKNNDEKLLLSLSLLSSKGSLYPDSLDKFEYYDYPNNSDGMIPIWIMLDFEKNLESFIKPLMIYTHMYITGVKDDFVSNEDIIRKILDFYSDNTKK